ncbi:unnamed protein product [Prorocentrum cordatum]|uniref:Ribosome biogenesis protein NOP53 n=1 Tax=Prorocentrum cordatum TaxID=2364126 RepID=A0ABN9XGV9_9DINO|nr:unnamed protein product [Polarella glacialis]
MPPKARASAAARTAKPITKQDEQRKKTNTQAKHIDDLKKGNVNQRALLSDTRKTARTRDNTTQRFAKCTDRAAKQLRRKKERKRYEAWEQEAMGRYDAWKASDDGSGSIQPSSDSSAMDDEGPNDPTKTTKTRAAQAGGPLVDFRPQSEISKLLDADDDNIFSELK